MLLDATQNFAAPLTRERLFGWQAALFPTGWSGMFRIKVGDWRDDSAGPMQVVSGVIGREKIHFQAPPAMLLETEMKRFLSWFEDRQTLDPVLKSGLAHLWFVTIHPFDDGNGRIARAIADLALARAEGIPERFYSMSSQIRTEKKEYYRILEQTQKGSMDVTAWLLWYLNCLHHAVKGAQTIQRNVLRAAQFWQSVSTVSLNNRQKKVLNKLLDGLEGKLTTSQWANLTKCSQDTAHRDIIELVEVGILEKDKGGGRSTSYSLSERDFAK